MSLPLDARQRAMLQEMGVHVWSPAPAAAMVATAPAVATGIPASILGPAAPITSITPVAPRPAARVPTVAAVAASNTLPPHTKTGPVVLLHPPQRLFAPTQAQEMQEAQEASLALGAAWLILAEGCMEADPLAGTAGELLRNMLRALKLHQHPRIFFCGVELATDALPNNASTPAAVLAQAVAQIQPSMVLLMGRLAARTALNRTEPLGQLRAQPHSVLGHPAIVTYEAPYLLRHGQYKAAAWADLCMACALGQAGYKG